MDSQTKTPAPGGPEPEPPDEPGNPPVDDE